MVLHLRPVTCLAVLVWQFGLFGSSALAGVAITECVVDGERLPLEVSGTLRDAEMKAIRTRSSSIMMQFRFSSDTNAHRPAMILRYKLEGHDDDWRDLPTGMRVVLRFYTSKWVFVGGKEFPLEGETPEWRGNVKNSDYVSMQRQAVVPAGAEHARVSFMSGGKDSDVGVMGIDAVKVSVERPGESRPRTFDWSVTKGDDLVYPLGRPANWVREGSGADLAQLKTRLQPERHTMLVLVDDDPERSGAWSVRPECGIPVVPGDRVTLQWQTAYSVGNAGPGTASYERLPPGNYWFRVATFQVNGEQTGIASLPILVVAPYYQRAEFWGGIAAAVSAVAALIVWRVARRRVKAKIERMERERTLERERARIARDLHDEIGAGLTEIAMQTDWIRRELCDGNNQETQRRADRVCESAVELVRSVDEIVWAVNPANDRLDRFINYLTQYTEQFLDSAGLSLRFDIPPELPLVPLSGTLRHTLFLAVSESLNNVVKHAQANQVRMKIAAEDGWLRIVVEDDGRGFDPAVLAAEGTHEGLNNMQRRMEQWGGHFILTSCCGQGAQVEFQLPLTPTSSRPAVAG